MPAQPQNRNSVTATALLLGCREALPADPTIRPSWGRTRTALALLPGAGAVLQSAIGPFSVASAPDRGPVKLAARALGPWGATRERRCAARTEPCNKRLSRALDLRTSERRFSEVDDPRSTTYNRSDIRDIFKEPARALVDYG